jgi:hypothetical protein
MANSLCSSAMRVCEGRGNHESRLWLRLANAQKAQSNNHVKRTRCSRKPVETPLPLDRKQQFYGLAELRKGRGFSSWLGLEKL